jgi:carboxyl-terminal processing protease
MELARPLFGADTDPQPPITATTTTTDSSLPAKLANLKPLSPGAMDASIAHTTTKMLKDFHYLHLDFDPALSSKFLDLYINTFDPQHMHFLQSDVAEFEPYRNQLGVLTRERGDTRPAYVIFNRFMERLQARSVFAEQLLDNEEFDFTGKDRIELNRKTAPFPKDLAEAQQLWRERVRYEYLEEKLNRENPKSLARFIAERHTPWGFALMPTDFHRGIVEFIDTRYNRIWRNFREWESDKVLETYLTTLSHLYDPHSDYYDRDSLDSFSIQMSLSLFGIGALLEEDDDGYCKIHSLTPGAPAAKSKELKPGDRIVSVAQGTNEPVDVVQMPLTKVVDQIRGQKGTQVRLTVIPAGADTSTRKTIAITRDEIKLEDQQAKAKLIELTNEEGQTNRLGVIDLPSFYASFSVIGVHNQRDIKSATQDVDRLLTKLQENHVDGVILDLRHNGGGSLPEAIDLTGLFIKDGPVVQVKSSNPNEPVQVDEDTDPRIQYGGPLVVLTSRFSASASEIVAGALQDYGRAVVVGGASTHGKGTVQSMSQLAQYLYMNHEQIVGNPADYGALKYTTNKFYRVTGSSTQLKGVVPDIVLPSSYDYMETEEAREENAMPWDTIDSTKYAKLNLVQPFAGELEKRSTKRVASSKDFDYVREDIELVKKAMSDKSASLNEEQRLKESADLEARKKVREAEMKARKEPDLKVYDLTLKDGAVVMAEAKKVSTNSVAGVTSTSKSGFGSTSATNSIVNPEENPSNVENPDDATAQAASEPDIPSPEEKAPMDEAERILMDYISLLHSHSDLTAEHQTTVVP